MRWGVANTRQFLQHLATLGRDVSACSERVSVAENEVVRQELYCVLRVETGKFYHNDKNKGGSFGPETPGAVGEAAHNNRCKVCLIMQVVDVKNLATRTPEVLSELIRLNQTMPTIVSGVENSSMCCYLVLIARLLDQ